MNSSRLRELVDKVVDAEQRHRIQKLLNGVNGALSNLVSNPADASHQNAFVSSIDSFRDAVAALRQEFQPAEFDRLDEIGGGRYFAGDLADEIAGWLAENPATPAVAQEKLSTFLQEREGYLTQVRQLRESLEKLGIEADQLEPGEAEIGFLLPRSLFNNEFDKLIRELGAVNRIIRAFSEAATGTAETIEVRQISTSDPVFSFGLCTATIIAIGRATTWALDTWKKVEEIRKLRAETAKIEALKGGPIDQQFEKAIKDTIAKEIESKTAELLEGAKSDVGRKNEQVTDLKWALESILARVERGMTVEIRLFPPPEQASEEGEKTQTSVDFQTLGEISSQLSFPRMEGEPIIAIPNPDPKKPAGQKAAPT